MVTKKLRFLSAFILIFHLTSVLNKINIIDFAILLTAYWLG